ncbi:MAG TPA: type I-B CRISPR-associated protein Cas5 [Paenibacillaceae bacterium]|nr:type I-B CRISPR-associated protein Cas5 [Paenibacillaceae bacterium]
METLIFDLTGDLGHFRKFYTTSSPLTFSFIPPTTTFGVLGAILGLEKDNNEYIHILGEANTKVAIGINKPVNKIRMGINLINTKGSVWVPKQRREGARTQIRTEFLKNPSFRLYVTMEDKELFWKLVEEVKGHKTFYTLSLGLSECLADFTFVDVENFQLIENKNSDQREISTVIPLSEIEWEKGIPFNQGKKYLKERMPTRMNQQRVVQQFEEMIFESNGGTVECTPKRWWESQNNRRIIFF